LKIVAHTQLDSGEEMYVRAYKLLFLDKINNESWHFWSRDKEGLR
jgi:hypothetical protein